VIVGILLNVYGRKEWNCREQKKEDEAKFHVGGILAVGVAERNICDSKGMTAAFEYVRTCPNEDRAGKGLTAAQKVAAATCDAWFAAGGLGPLVH
jgi:hypothetical protein